MHCFSNKPIQRKIILLGDGACGKTSLLNLFTRGFFPTAYAPTVVEHYVHDIFVDDTHVELHLWDMAGQEDYNRLRQLVYEGTHTAMLCFSVDSVPSYRNVSEKWRPGVLAEIPDTPVVLVALKCDLREPGKEEGEEKPSGMDAAAAAATAAAAVTESEGRDGLRAPIEYDKGLELAREIKALRYFECSALKDRGVQEAFLETAKVALTVPSGKESKGCIVL